VAKVGGMSELSHSRLLGRRIRTGDAAQLGVPTWQLAAEALAAGDPATAREYLEYALEEAGRVIGLYATWLESMLAFGRDRVPGFEARVAQLEETIGVPPPLVDPEVICHVEHEHAAAALAADDRTDFEAALVSLREAGRVVHDAQADWSWGLLTVFRDVLGEDSMDEVFRETQGRWLAERYEKIAEMSPLESLELTIEGMRGHYSGRGRGGWVEVAEDDEKWVLSFDPCGSGGRMRRGDPERGQSSRDEPPFAFGYTHEAHDWSWGRKDVCLYCAHCAVVNEILPIESLGAPMRVTDHPEDASQPCRWTIYKSTELVPDGVYERVGRRPPERQ
jgi:hypothetical protein